MKKQIKTVSNLSVILALGAASLPASALAQGLPKPKSISPADKHAVGALMLGAADQALSAVSAASLLGDLPPQVELGIFAASLSQQIQSSTAIQTYQDRVKADVLTEVPSPMTQTSREAAYVKLIGEEKALQSRIASESAISPEEAYDISKLSSVEQILDQSSSVQAPHQGAAQLATMDLLQTTLNKLRAAHGLATQERLPEVDPNQVRDLLLKSLPQLGGSSPAPLHGALGSSKKSLN